MMKYIYEIVVYDQNDELAHNIRDFFVAPNDSFAKKVTNQLSKSLKEGYSRFYGKNCVKKVNFFRLEEVL